MTTTADRLTDADDMPSLRRFMAFKIGKALDRKDKRRARTRTQAAIRVVLQLTGFACLTISGFIWHPIAGFVVAGLSCFTLSLLLTTGEQSEPFGHLGMTR